MATPVAASNRRRTITITDSGSTLEIGPPAANNSTGVWMLQFNPSIGFVGSLQIQGRVQGTAAQIAVPPAPPVPIPYRRVSLGNVAQDYALVSDAITGAALIQVPANGLSVLIQVVVTAGTCDLFSWDMAGSSSV